LFNIENNIQSSLIVRMFEGG